MASRIDHSNCTHPRTPAGRAACRKDWHRPEGISGVETPPTSLTREQLMTGMTTKQKARFAGQMASDAAQARGRMAKADAKVRVITRVEDLPMPKLTPAQLASPIYQSMMRKRG
jgi:hypothetical protein